MSADIKRKNKGNLALISAVLLNAVFLAALLAFIAPGFESNDDQTMASFVDGQMAEKCAYIPFINYGLGLLLKGIYTLLGDGVAWYTVGQYILIFLGFTALTVVFFERLRFRQGVMLAVLMLAVFAPGAYCTINFTRTAAVVTVSGLGLMFNAMEKEKPDRRTLALTLGIVLVLFGYMLRYLEFLTCAALMAALGLGRLIDLAFENKGKDRLRQVASYIAPFSLLLVLVAALWVFDDAAWSREPWKAYEEFTVARARACDYGITSYASGMYDYDKLGLGTEDIDILLSWDFFDPDVFTAATMNSVADIRNSVFPAYSPLRCIQIFFNRCIPGFFKGLPIYGAIGAALLWLFCGKREKRSLLPVLCVLAFFALFYLYLIRKGRFLIDRVDYGLFLALFAVLTFQIDRVSMGRRKILCGVLLAGSLMWSLWMSKDSFRINQDPVSEQSRQQQKTVVNYLLSDDEHVFLCHTGLLKIEDCYGAFEPLPAGYGDKLPLLGGWPAKNPAIMASLENFGVKNPFRDMINNDRVYVVHDQIDLIIRYLHKHYDQNAYAELVEPLSTETGYNIYRILS